MIQVLILLQVLLLFNLIIFVHELGHFWAARWRGMKVEKFGLWFGRPIWKKTYNGVEYSVGWIPAGGFVSLPEMNPMDTLEGKSSQPSASAKPLDKAIVAFAGPLASVTLAIALATIVWIIGKPTSVSEVDNTIGFVEPSSPAAAAGIKPGDKILKINNTPITGFAGLTNAKHSVVWNIANGGPRVELLVSRNNVEHSFSIESDSATAAWYQRKPLRQIGVRPVQPVQVLEVEKNSPAEAAGIVAGDKITKADGVPILSPFALDNAIKTANNNILVTINRNGKELEKDINVGESKKLGIRLDPSAGVITTYPTPLASVLGSATTLWITIKALISPTSEIKLQHMSGPVGILRIYYILFEQADGWKLAIYFSVILNINLALFNLLPLPVLDGGHIALSAMEAARRKNLNKRVLAGIQTSCALLLIAFMLYITLYDVVSIFVD